MFERGGGGDFDPHPRHPGRARRAAVTRRGREDMRRYDDPVEVRRGETEGPEQFLWRGRLWKVYAVVAHWVETGPGWRSASARSVLGAETEGMVRRDPPGSDSLGEREVWRVEAGRGLLASTGGV